MENVADLVNAIAHDVKVLEDGTVRAVLPALLRARVELQRDLGQWLESHHDGAERFTAQQFRRAIASVDAALATIGQMHPDMVTHMTGAARAASVMAAGHLTDQLTLFGNMFGGSIRPTKISSAALMARANREIIPRIRTSSARYVQSVREDLRQQFAIGLAKGENFEQLTNRLRRLGGPRGHVALRGVAGEPGAHVEEIAEGLFNRYRHWAERVVRTEVINAYNAEHQAGIEELNDDLRDDGQEPLEQKWDATPDFRLCPLCAELDGQTRKVGEAFAPGVYHPPRHPSCRCVVVAWHPSWGPSKPRTSASSKSRAKPTPKPKPKPRENAATPRRRNKKSVDANVTEAMDAVAQGKFLEARRAIDRDLTARKYAAKGFTPLGRVSIENMPPGRRGEHELRTATVKLATHVAEEARTFATEFATDPARARAQLEAAAGARDAWALRKQGPPPPPTPLERSAQGMRTLVHETLHGYGPLRANEYAGVSVAVEEVSTEVLARKYMNDHFGFSKHLGAYQDMVDSATAAIREALKVNDSEATRILELASGRLKSDRGAPNDGSQPPSMASRLARHVAAVSPSRKASDNRAHLALQFEDGSYASRHEDAIRKALWQRLK